MTADTPHKPKMAIKSTTPPGLELDAHGNPIPFEKRTEGDKEKVRANIAARIHGEPSDKDPEGEAESPAAMPQDRAATHDPSGGPSDPAGQQGGTKGGGKG